MKKLFKILFALLLAFTLFDVPNGTRFVNAEEPTITVEPESSQETEGEDPINTDSLNEEETTDRMGTNGLS